MNVLGGERGHSVGAEHTLVHIQLLVMDRAAIGLLVIYDTILQVRMDVTLLRHVSILLVALHALLSA